ADGDVEPGQPPAPGEGHRGGDRQQWHEHEGEDGVALGSGALLLQDLRLGSPSCLDSLGCRGQCPPRSRRPYGLDGSPRTATPLLAGGRTPPHQANPGQEAGRADRCDARPTTGGRTTYTYVTVTYGVVGLARGGGR